MSRPRKRAFSRVLSHFLHLCSTFIAFPPSRLFSHARAYIYNVYARRYQSESWIIRNLPPCGDEARTTRCTAAYKSIAASLISQGSSDALAKVDLEGIEPSSKRGNHMLSTCLFPYWIVGQSVGREQPCTMPYPLKFHLRHEATADYLRYAAPR